jgi:glycosyltransferase involved in cell wall biosynthesis
MGELTAQMTGGHSSRRLDAPRNPVRVVHIITGLDIGGAEGMLARLLDAFGRRFDSHVVSLTTEGAMAEQMRRAGATVHTLLMKRNNVPNPFMLFRLVRLLRQIKPQIVQTWLYHADLLGSIAARLAGVERIAWNIRAGELSREAKMTTRGAMRLCAMLSGWLPQAIVCCSEAARAIHQERGYDRDRFVVIPNGFDLGRFKPDENARLAVRREHSIPSDAPLIGLIARFDPQKNHELFFAATRQLRETYPSAHYLLAGRNVDASNPHIGRWMDEAGVAPVTRLLGERIDIPRLTAALDIATSCSTWGEAFSNTLGEALACGVPCVSTNVGDAALIVGTAGRTIAPDDAAALATAWKDLLALSPVQRKGLGEMARARIARYEIGVVAKRYTDLYESLAAGESLLVR